MKVDVEVRRTLEYQAKRWEKVIRFINDVTDKIGADTSTRIARSIDLFIIGKCTSQEEELIKSFTIEMTKECGISPEERTDPMWPIIQMLLLGCGYGAMVMSAQASEINFRDQTSSWADHTEIEAFVMDRINTLGLVRGTRKKIVYEIQEKFKCKKSKAEGIFDRVKKKYP